MLNKNKQPTSLLRLAILLFVVITIFTACVDINDASTDAYTNAPDSGSASSQNMEPENHDEANSIPVEPSVPILVSLAYDDPDVVLAPGEEYRPVLTFRYSEDSPHTTTPQLQYDINSTNAEVLPDGTIQIAEDASIGSEIVVTATSDDIQAELRIHVRYSAQETITDTNADGIPVVSNPDHIAVFVNKERSLPENFIPQNLVQPDVTFSFEGDSEKKLLQEPAAKALENLFAAAEQDDITLRAVSGYRSYATQKALFNYYIQTEGEEHARRYSAYPGTSEHQTGLAMDVSTPSVNNQLTDTLGSMEEGKWLEAHCAEFGFIIRYPFGKEDITGYAYEPWHLRYVGTDLAKLIMENHSTLEEYFNDSLPVFAQD